MVKSIGIYWLCLLSSGSIFMGHPLQQQPPAFHSGHVMQFIPQVCSFLFQYNCWPTPASLEFTGYSFQLFRVFHESQSIAHGSATVREQLMFAGVCPESTDTMSARGLSMSSMLNLGGQSQFNHQPCGSWVCVPSPARPGTLNSTRAHTCELQHGKAASECVLWVWDVCRGIHVWVTAETSIRVCALGLGYMERHTHVSYSMGKHQIVCFGFGMCAEDSWAVTRTEEGTWSQTCFVPSTPVWLFAEALNSSAAQHVGCACLAVHKTSKDTVRGLHISQPETVQSMLMFPYLQVNKQTNKQTKWRNKSNYITFLALNLIRW